MFEKKDIDFFKHEGAKNKLRSVMQDYLNNTKMALEDCTKDDCKHYEERIFSAKESLIRVDQLYKEYIKLKNGGILEVK